MRLKPKRRVPFIGFIGPLFAGFMLASQMVVSATVPDRLDGDSVGPQPNAALGPEEVVKIQLEALRANDSSDHGIEICFRFASPRNQANTGPVDRFANMLRSGIYALMLDYEDAEYEPVEIVERFARQKVTLLGATRIIKYVFYLSRQSDAGCEGCWMTDSVDVEQVIEAT